MAQKLLSQMLPHHVIRSKLANHFQVGYTTAEKCIKLARADWAKNPINTREETREQMRAALGLAYVECMAKGAYGSAIRALKEIAIVEGLYVGKFGGGATAGEETDDSEDLGTRDPERVRERMAELAARYKDQIEDLQKRGKAKGTDPHKAAQALGVVLPPGYKA
jgi:hypothetical protein